MTLLELLVVVLILLMVTAAAIPIVAPAMQNRQMREAARLASSYFSQARSRAIETGRPVGVMIERFNGQPFALVLSQVGVPEPYSGDFIDSRATLNITPGAVSITGFVAGDMLWQGLVRYGDQVQLSFKGPTYVLASQAVITPEAFTDNPANPNGEYDAGENYTDANMNGKYDVGDPQFGKAVMGPPGSANWFLVTSTGAAPTAMPATYAAPTGLPFRIIRQPTRSSTAPLQLPESVVIDLYSSGMGASGSYGSLAFDPIVLFSPSGRLEAVSKAPVGTLAHPASAVYFLLGRRDLMPDAAPSMTDENLHSATSQHLSNFWIGIGYQTGLVSVAENSQQTTSPPNLSEARELAISGQSLGGN